MRVRPLLFALATAMVFGCAGRDSFTGSGTQAGGGNNPGDASQTQPDAGDAGVPPGTTDAGCTLQTLPTGQVAASDTCSVGGAGLTATVIAASCLDVTISVTDVTTAGQDVAGYFTHEEWAEAAHDDVTLDEVRRALSTISGSLSEAVIALRQER